MTSKTTTPTVEQICAPVPTREQNKEGEQLSDIKSNGSALYLIVSNLCQVFAIFTYLSMILKALSALSSSVGVLWPKNDAGVMYLQINSFFFLKKFLL